jgi:hypothetical protein
LGHVLGGEGIGEVELDEFEFCVVFGAGAVGGLVGGYAVERGDDDRDGNEEEIYCQLSHEVQI